MNAKTPRRLSIVTPVFNDWPSLTRLLDDVAAAMATSGCAIDVLAVDDCSTEQIPASLACPAPLERIEALRLSANVGHQRAIAIGLMTLAERSDLDLVAVMDSDGEDRPEELSRLVASAMGDDARAYVAQRAERSKSWFFKLFYVLYIRLFRLLTGHRIMFGNFSVLSAAQVRRVCNSAQVWNNFPAAIIHARVPIVYVPTRRGVRYEGQSRMNFIGLVAHGLGAISVFSEAVFIRILVASAALLGISVALGAVALGMKLFSALAFPNWATTVLGFALLASIQAVMMPVMMAFLLLNNRSTVQPLPRTVATSYVAERLVLASAGKS